MNREGAETFLRLVAEAEMRGQLARSKVMVAGQALTAVGALDIGTVEDILADFDLAVSVRQLYEKSRPAGTMRAAAAARLAAQIGFGRVRANLNVGRRRAAGLTAEAARTGCPGPATRRAARRAHCPAGRPNCYGGRSRRTSWRTVCGGSAC